MKVSEQFIANLSSRIDLVDLIGKKVALRQAGANFVGLCPFHQEKTPSFTVNKNKQFFHCFGCKESGDAIRFTMLLERKGFLETVEELANQYGLCLEKAPSPLPNPLIEKIYKILNLAVDFYHQELLKNNPQAVAALGYLTNRGINLTTIRNFKLGFVNANWTGLIDFFEQQITEHSLENEQDLKNLLQQAGLILEKNGKFYDRFRSRVMFPIRNKFGKVIAFGARALSDEQIPKYLNSPETIVFSKQQELYGLYEVKTRLRNLNSLIVVEGYLDVLTLVQAEVCNVVATLGTALNEHHIKTIVNIVPEVIFCFDGDTAGYKAAARAMELSIELIGAGVLNSKHIVKFISLPSGHDPDSIIREKGVQEFKQLIVEAKVLSDFFFEYLYKKYPDRNIENLNKLAQEAKMQIAKLKNNLLQNLWYEKLAGILGIDSVVFKTEQNSEQKTEQNRFNKKTQQKTQNYNYPISNAIKALAMLLINNSLLSLCDELNINNNEKLAIQTLPADIDLFITVVNIFRDKKDLLLKNENDNIIEKLTSYLAPVYVQKLLLLDVNKIVQCIPADGMEQEFIGAVKKIKRVLVEQTVDDLLILSKQRSLAEQEKLLLQQLLQCFN